MPPNETASRCGQCGRPLPEGGSCHRCLATVVADELASEAGRPEPVNVIDQPRLTTLGPYTLLEEIARGGMGVVYRARQAGLNRDVAVKVILAGPFAGNVAIARFRTEAEAAARLRHPHIVTVHEVGESGGHHWLSMDYVAGPTLAALTRDGPLPVRQAARYVRVVADAVEHAHRHGIIHRDLKPGNVLIDADDEPRVTDFGLAKQLDQVDSPTLSGQGLGTPGFAAPEQLSPKLGAVGARSDVYGLGALLYHLLTGRPPFLAGSPAETVQQVMNAEPAPPRALNPAVPRDLETICRKCLAKEPARRYATALEVERDLQRWLEGEPIAARPTPTWERVWLWCRRRPAVAIPSALAALALLAIAVGSPFLASRMRFAEVTTAEKSLAAARASRFSQASGRRFDALQHISNAMTMNPSAALKDELRREAIAALALCDVRRKERLFAGPGQQISMMPDFHRYIVTGAGKPTVIYDLATHQPMREIPGTEAIQGIRSFDSSGRYASVWSLQGREFVVDLNTGRTVLEIQRPHLKDLSFSSDGKQVVACQLEEAGQTVEVAIFEVPSGRCLFRHSASNRPYRARFSPSGALLALSTEDSGEVQIMETLTGRVVRRWTAPHRVAQLSWHPDGRRLAGSYDEGGIFIWDIEREEEPRQRRLHHNFAIMVTFSHSGELLATGGWDSRICLSDPEAFETLVDFPTDATVEIRFSPDDRQLSASSWQDGDQAGFCDLLELAPPSEYRVRRRADTTRFPHPYDQRIAFSPDARYLVCLDDTGATAWDTFHLTELARLPLPGACSATFAPDGRSLFLGGQHTALKWPLTNDSSGITCGPRQIVTETENSERKGMVAIPANGQTLAIGSRDRIRFFDPVTLAPLGETERHADPLYLALSDDGRFAVSAYWSDPAVVWQVPDGKRFANLDLLHHPLFAPKKHTLLASVQDQTKGVYERRWISIHDPATTNMFGVQEEQGRPFAFSGDGRFLASQVNYRECRLVDAVAGREVARIIPPSRDGEISAVALTRDGSWLACYNNPGILQLWNLRLIRQQLRALGLDWELPEFGPPPALTSTLPAPWTVHLNRIGDMKPQHVPRLTNTPSALVELTDYYNGSLTQPWYLEDRAVVNTLRGLPKGVVSLGGVKYDIRGVIQVGGYTVLGFPYPRAVRDIAVNRDCTKLHFLHAAVGFATPGTVVGYYRINYADGQGAYVTLGDQVNTGDWTDSGLRKPLEVEVAWEGQDRGQGAETLQTIRLFHFAWTNPRPDVAIKSLDLIAAEDVPAPFLVAVTAE